MKCPSCMKTLSNILDDWRPPITYITSAIPPPCALFHEVHEVAGVAWAVFNNEYSEPRVIEVWQDGPYKGALKTTYEGGPGYKAINGTPAAHVAVMDTLQDMEDIIWDGI